MSVLSLSSEKLLSQIFKMYTIPSNKTIAVCIANTENFSMHWDGDNKKSIFVKTKLCKFWIQGRCYNQDKMCPYAHGINDLRSTKIKNNFQQKTRWI